MSLIKITDIPQSDIGAPTPFLLSNEHRLSLIYYLQEDNPSFDGSTVKVVTPESQGLCGIVTFEYYYAYKFGPPNDEAIEGHPLYKMGLEPYSTYSVSNSSWIKELKNMNSVHLHHDDKQFQKYKHYIWTFHDTTFECVAEQYSFEISHGSILTLAQENLKSFSEY